MDLVSTIEQYTKKKLTAIQIQKITDSRYLVKTILHFMQNRKGIYILTGSEGSLGKKIKNYYNSKKINILCLDSSGKHDF